MTPAPAPPSPTKPTGSSTTSTTAAETTTSTAGGAGGIPAPPVAAGARWLAAVSVVAAAKSRHSHVLTCGGSGTVYVSSSQTCNNCGGSGSIYKEVSTGCPKCGGTGMVGGYTCDRCDGWGVVRNSNRAVRCAEAAGVYRVAATRPAALVGEAARSPVPVLVLPAGEVGG